MQEDYNRQIETMYEETHIRLLAIAAQMGIPDTDQEDLLQDTLLAYLVHYSLDWNSRQQYGMLRRIMKNKCMDYFRRISHERVAFAGETFQEEQYLIQEFSESHPFEDLQEAREFCLLAMETIDHMKSGMRETAVLYFLERVGEKQIAEQLHISDITCRQRICRARQILKRVLTGKDKL